MLGANDRCTNTHLDIVVVVALVVVQLRLRNGFIGLLRHFEMIWGGLGCLRGYASTVLLAGEETRSRVRVGARDERWCATLIEVVIGGYSRQECHSLGRCVSGKIFILYDSQRVLRVLSKLFATRRLCREYISGNSGCTCGGWDSAHRGYARPLRIFSARELGGMVLRGNAAQVYVVYTRECATSKATRLVTSWRM